MQKTRDADLFIEVGMSLELWADAVIQGSGNPDIAAGRPGRVIASAGIQPLEVPAVISREMGDIHPQGNPHLWLDPVRAKRMAANIERGLESKSPADGDLFRGRLKSFEDRVDEALYGKDLLKAVGARTLDRLVLEGRLLPFLDANEFGGKKLSALAGGWISKAARMKGTKAVEYHKVWVYFARTFGIDLRGTIEERPGIPPGPQYLQGLIKRIRDEGAKLILVDNFYDPALPNRVGADTGARVVLLPNQVRGEPGVDDYFALIDYVLGKVAGAMEAR
jgi:ABC-type Zn uptake system ZnuABC Zn-binding protein ZnuA